MPVGYYSYQVTRQLRKCWRQHCKTPTTQGIKGTSKSRTQSNYKSQGTVLGWATAKRKRLPCKVSVISSAFSFFSGFSDWEDRGSSAGCPLVEGSVGGSKVSFANGWTKQKQQRNNSSITHLNLSGYQVSRQLRKCWHQPCETSTSTRDKGYQ